MPRVRRVSSRIFCLQRNKAFGETRRFGILVVAEAEPQELPLSWSGHRTLGLVHLKLEPSREEARDIRHHPLSRPLAADIDVAVVRIPHEAMLAPFELAVEFVEHDVR